MFIITLIFIVFGFCEEGRLIRMPTAEEFEMQRLSQQRQRVQQIYNEQSERVKQKWSEHAERVREFYSANRSTRSDPFAEERRSIRSEQDAVYKQYMDALSAINRSSVQLSISRNNKPIMRYDIRIAQQKALKEPYDSLTSDIQAQWLKSTEGWDKYFTELFSEMKKNVLSQKEEVSKKICKSELEPVLKNKVKQSFQEVSYKIDGLIEELNKAIQTEIRIEKLEANQGLKDLLQGLLSEASSLEEARQHLGWNMQIRAQRIKKVEDSIKYAMSKDEKFQISPLWVYLVKEVQDKMVSQRIKFEPYKKEKDSLRRKYLQPFFVFEKTLVDSLKDKTQLRKDFQNIHQNIDRLLSEIDTLYESNEESKLKAVVEKISSELKKEIPLWTTETTRSYNALLEP